ncbi:MAG: hypothetical protein IJH83_05350, partial [Coriobacteriales bacterium]|nr:hypothetical protein [Coriobacteriales bacterium]
MANESESATRMIREALFGAKGQAGNALTGSYLLAITGVAFAIVADEFRRFPNTIGVSTTLGSTVPSLICTVIVLALLAFVYAMRPTLRFSKHPVLVICLTVALTLATFVFFYLPGDLETVEMERFFTGMLCITKSLAAVLLVFWMEAVSRAGMRRMLLVFGLSLFIVAIFKTLLAVLVGGAATLLMSLSSLISGVFLILFARRSETDGFLGDEVLDQDVLASENEHAMLSWFYPFAAFCFAAISALARNNWRMFYTSESSLLSNFGDVLGAVLAAFMLLYFISRMWSKQWVDFVKTAMLPISIFLLYCTTFADESLVFVYATACGAYKRLIVFFVCGLFFYKHRRNQMIPFVIALLATRIGILTMYFERYLTRQGNLVGAHLLVCGILLALVLTTLYVAFREYRNKLLSIEEANEDMKSSEAVIASEEYSGIRQRALNEIAEQFQLSGRESDILPYIAKGRTAPYIADE